MRQALSPDTSTKRRFAEYRWLHGMLLTAIGLLFSAISLAGILAPDTVYPTTDLHTSFLPNDYVDLFFGVPVFILSTIAWLRRSRLGKIGLGASLLFILYNGIAYLFALRAVFSSILLSLTVILCLVELLFWAFSLREPWLFVQEGRLRRPKIYGIILLGMGLLFVIRAISNLAGSLNGTLLLSLPEAGVNLADVIICSVWITSGILLLLKRPGRYYIPAAAAFAHGSLLFLALLLFMALQPALCDTGFVAEDIAVIGGMSLLAILPCLLLLRRILPTAGKP